MARAGGAAANVRRQQACKNYTAQRSDSEVAAVFTPPARNIPSAKRYAVKDALLLFYLPSAIYRAPRC